MSNYKNKQKAIELIQNCDAFVLAATDIDGSTFQTSGDVVAVAELSKIVGIRTEMFLCSAFQAGQSPEVEVEPENQETAIEE